MSAFAQYGSFDINMNPISTEDVSACVESHRSAAGEIILPKNLKSSSTFKPLIERDGYIQINDGGNIHHVLVDNYIHDIKLSSSEQRELIIVYNVFIIL